MLISGEMIPVVDEKKKTSGNSDYARWRDELLPIWYLRRDNVSAMCS
jgi:hypothetical protein